MRRSNRMRVKANTVLKNAEGGRAEGQIINITDLGCAVRIEGSCLPIDRYCSIKIDSLELLTGKVVWAREPFAGLEFHPALHPAVAQNIAKKFPADDGELASGNDEMPVEIVRRRAH